MPVFAVVALILGHLMKGNFMSLCSLRRALAAATLLLAACFSACTSAPAPRDSVQAAPKRPSIVFMTDFGTANDAVALCKAVILNIAPEARIMDITHQVTPFQIEEASRF